MNENEIERIAGMASALRPDWPLSSLRTLLSKPELANRTRRDVAVALAWVACESKTKTPARVLEAGPWWQATNAEGSTVAIRNPTKAEACATCGRRQADHASRWVGDHEFTPLAQASRNRAAWDQGLAEARVVLTDALTALCRHGIDRAHVRCGECERPAPEPTPDPAARSHPDAQTAQIAEET